MKKIFVAVAAITASLFLPPSSSYAAIGPGVGVVKPNLLMAWDWNNAFSYPGSGAVTSDLADYNETATSTSGVTYSTANGGTVNFSTGTSQYLTIPSFSYDFSAGFSATFYANFGTADNFERIIDFGVGEWNNNIAIFRFGTTNDISFGVYFNGSDKSICTASNAILNSTYAHYAITVSSTGTCKFYRNGSALTTSQTTTDARPTNTINRTSNFIGHSNWVNDANSGLSLGDLAIYNSELSSSAVNVNNIAQTDLVKPTLGNNTASVNENQSVGLTLSSTEASTFYIVGGADQGKFNINLNSGAIAFIDAPNFEAPTDTGGNNIYEVSIRGVDSYGNSTEIAVAITVLNVAEFAALTAPALSATPVKRTAVTITVTPTAGNTSGFITYLIAGKRIPGCIKKSYGGTGSATCLWTPAITGVREIAVTFTPNGSEYAPATSRKSFLIGNRSTTR